MIKYFETISIEETFKIFDTPHLTVLSILLLLCLLIIIFRKKINKTAKSEKTVRYIIMIALIINEIAFYSWKIYAGEFTLAECLPFNMCTLSIFICIYLLFTQDKRIFPTLYFMGLGGATQALLTPSMGGYNFPHFRFFEYFSAHTLIIVTVCYALVILNYKINFIKAIKAFFAIQLAGIVAIIANILTGGNYMFLAYKPDSASIMDLLADWPYYIFQLELVLIVVMILLSLPFIIIYKKEFFSTKKKTSESLKNHSI